MITYLGTCMVIIVSGLVIGVLARIVTSGILDEIERVAQKRQKRKLEIIGKAMEGAVKYMNVYVDKLKQVSVFEKNAKEKGMTNEEMSKEAVRCCKETLDEFEK